MRSRCKMILFIFMLSILTEPLLSNINFNIISFSIYPSILSIIILYPYLKLYKLIIYSLIIGMTYTFLYTHSLIYIPIFILICLITYFIFKNSKYNIINIILTSMFIIFIYNTLTYFIYLLFYNLNISYTYLFGKLIFLYIFNAIYLILIYIFINIIPFKKIRQE